MTRPNPRLACSISAPAAEDLTRRGHGSEHVDLAFVEVARHALALGWDLTYGGDLRLGGHTDQLLELARSYLDHDVHADPTIRIRCYIAKPWWDAADAGARAMARNVAHVEVVEPDLPAGVDADGRLGRALALAEMRKRVTADCDARVILGGGLVGSSGSAPGVLEEVWRSVSAGRPVLLLGGFGGVARLVADRFLGLPVGYREAAIAADPGYRAVSELAAAAGLQDALPGPTAMLDDLLAVGQPGLGTGLSASDQELLLTSDDLNEVLPLVWAALCASSA